MKPLHLASTLALLPLLSSLACFRGGPPEGEVELKNGLGGGDGGAEDTGTVDTGLEVGVLGLRGDGEISTGLGGGYTGAEELYTATLEGEDRCVITSQVADVELAVPECKECEWTFTLQTSGTTASAGCEGVDPAAYDGASFSYAYFDTGKYGLLAYYYAGYGWYSTYATASFDGVSRQFTYDWPLSYTYLY